MFIRRNIPNTITLGNLLCGCLAIVKAFEGDLVWAAYLVGIAAVLDFFDGFAARLLGVSSPIGKDLDSLADMVTFGVVPGVIMFTLINLSLPDGILVHFQTPDFPNDIGGKPDFSWYEKQYKFLAYMAFIIPIFSSIRLARFNNDIRQAHSFIGLPTPANAILICSLPLIIRFYSPVPYEVPPSYEFGGIANMYKLMDDEWNSEKLSGFQEMCKLILNPWLLTSLSVISAFLLVAPIPLFALKFKNFAWKGNEIRYIFLIWSVLLLVFLQFIGIPLVIISYILFSLVNNLVSKKQGPEAG